MKKQLIFLCIIFSLFSSSLYAQKGYVPAEENLSNRERFQDDKFGVFIHWGLYSMMADGEWIMHNKNINHKEYRKLASGFYPSKFNADEWVSTVKASGARYICITSRHHDGFSMFNTQYSDYNIVKATPFKRDILKELADACQKHDIRLHVYYSHLDWDRSDYPIGRTGKKTGRTGSADWKTYYQFMNNQLSEILTNYGPIGAIWFDGLWDHDMHPDFDWELDEQYALIHRLQPGCLIANNHHKVPFEGEDLQLFERDLPGENKAGLSGQSISSIPLETCETMNKMWGYRITDTTYKSTKELIHYLVKAAVKNTNLLMNVGPQPNGEFPAVAIERLREMGEWLNVYGKTIYGTRGGIIAPHEWGGTTQKGNNLYVHILKLQDNALYLPLGDKKVKQAVVFKDNLPLKFTQTKEGVLLHLNKIPDEIDYVVELTLAQ